MDKLGQPIYGDRDKVDYRKLADLGFPFWIAGSYASPEKLAWAKENEARGIQVGTCFALCNQSGLDPALREKVRKAGYRGEQKVFTDPIASPTGFPFKVAVIPGTLSEKEVYENRPRICNQGALASPYRCPDGSIGYKCGAENANLHVKKGGRYEDTVGHKCICNGLMAAAGLNPDPTEPPIVTLGDDLSFLTHLMSDENSGYDVEDVFRYMLHEV
jgi:NAD(P)H-dependent flavin oxidoreductase YrpB (nitropropane dioxygenase family)